MELISCLVYSLTLKMETCSSETLIDFQQTTAFYPRRQLHNHHCRTQILQIRFRFIAEASSLSGYLHIMLHTIQNKLIHAVDEEHPPTASMTCYLTAKYRGGQQQKVQTS